MLNAIAVLLLTVGAIQQSPGYPALYQKLQLPEMPGAMVTSTGRQATSLADGLRIDLESQEDVAAALKFFRDRLSAGGWKESPSRAKVALASMGRVEFTKDRLTYTAMATRLGQTTKIQLNVLERAK